MSLHAQEAGGQTKRCSACGVEKELHEYYKKGSRAESKCKSCLKRVRAEEYRRKRCLPENYARCRITKVVVKEIQPASTEEFKREMEAVEVILENLIYKVLSKKLPKGNEHA